MRILVIVVIAAGVLAGLVFLKRPNPQTATQSEASRVSTEPTEVLPLAETASATAERTVNPSPATSPKERALDPEAAPNRTGLEKTMLGQALDILVSPLASYSQKRIAWKQLQDAGKIDLAIGELEQRMAADVRSAEYPAALGQAYLKKCAMIKDVREQGILAIQADKVFDTALNLDPSNWEARFTKAVALSYWPATMNKGDEVLQHFQTLIDQQETQSPQPQFAESYLWLGDQYQKTGHADTARTVWERGANLFPGHEGLRNRLSASAAQTASIPQGQ